MKSKIIFFVLILTLFVNVILIVFWNPTVNSNNEKVQSVFNNASYVYIGNNESILENLNNEQLKQLNNIFSDLSTFDVGIIRDNLSMCNEEDLIDTFRRLKRRLPKNEYKKVKEILSSVIDVDELERILKNKYE